MMLATALAAAAVLAGAAATPPPPPPPPAQTGQAAGPDVRRIPSPGGEVMLVGPRDEMAWNELKFAPIRRVGDVVYFSGVVVGPRAGEARDVTAFKAQTRRAFSYLEAGLKAAGLTFADVARIETFHVWAGSSFEGDKAAQFEAFAQVKDEFVKPPYPTWTAVGVTELLSSAGVVEIQLTAHVPAKAAAPTPPRPAARPPARPAAKPAPKPAPKPAAPAPRAAPARTRSTTGLDIPTDESALH